MGVTLYKEGSCPILEQNCLIYICKSICDGVTIGIIATRRVLSWPLRVSREKRNGMLCKVKRTRPKFFFPFFARFSFQDEGSFKIKKDYETRFEIMERHCAGWGEGGKGM